MRLQTSSTRLSAARAERCAEGCIGTRANASLAARLRDWPWIRRTVVNGRRWRSHLIDYWFNIRTSEPRDRNLIPTSSHHRDSTRYEPMDYLLLWKTMAPLTLSADDVVYEIGCGMGRTVCAFARRQIRKCVGVELMPELAEIAKENACRMRGRRAEIEIRAADAAHADYSDGTVFWLANPFGPSTLRVVFKAIERTLRERPRKIQVAYLYPKHEQVLREFQWLREFHRDPLPAYGSCEAVYWRNFVNDRLLEVKDSLTDDHSTVAHSTVTA